MIYLLNNAFMPYYKWMFRKMETLPKLSEVKDLYDKLFAVQTPEEKKYDYRKNLFYAFRGIKGAEVDGG